MNTKPKITVEMDEIAMGRLTQEERSRVRALIDHLNLCVRTLADAFDHMKKAFGDWFVYKGGSHVALHREAGDDYRIVLVKEQRPREPIPAKPKPTKVGKFVSVWERASRRHKWRITRAFVLVTLERVEDGKRFISWQESTSGGDTRTGWTSARLYECRCIRRPQFDVKPRH